MAGLSVQSLASCPPLASCNHVTAALRWRYIIEGGLPEKNNLQVG